MTADNQLEIKITQDLKTGEVQVMSNRPTTYNIMLRLELIALKGIKDNLLATIDKSTLQELIDNAFGDLLRDKVKDGVEDEDALREDIKLHMEETMYDALNYSVSEFLDNEFPRVNAKESLTEVAAREAGLDATASEEDLVKAEKDYIAKHPEEAAKTVDLQPTQIHNINMEDTTDGQ